MPVFVCFARFGVSSVLNIAYLSNVDLFPTLYSATALGICNCVGRAATVLAPYAAEINNVNVPIWMFLFMTALGMLLSQLIQKIPEKKTG